MSVSDILMFDDVEEDEFVYAEYEDFEGELEDHPAYKVFQTSLEEYFIKLEQIEIVETIAENVRLYGVSQNTAITLEEYHPFINDRIPIFTYTKEPSNINKIYVEEAIGDFFKSVVTFMIKHAGKIILALIALIGFILKGKGSGSSGGGGGGGSIVDTALKAKPVISQVSDPIKIKNLTREEEIKFRGRLVTKLIDMNKESIRNALEKKFTSSYFLSELDHWLIEDELDIDPNTSKVIQRINLDATTAINYISHNFKIPYYDEVLKEIGIELKDNEDLSSEVISSLVKITIKSLIDGTTISIFDDFKKIHNKVQTIKRGFLQLAGNKSIVEQKPKLSSVRNEYVTYLRQLNKVIFDFERFKLNDLERIAGEAMKRKIGDAYVVDKDKTAFTEEVLHLREINDIVLGNATTAVPVNNTLKICGAMFTNNINITAKDIFTSMIGFGGGNPKIEKMIKILDIQDVFKPTRLELWTLREMHSMYSGYISSTAAIEKFSEDSGLFSNSTMSSLRRLHHSIEEIEKDLAEFNEKFDTNFNTYWRNNFAVNATKEEQREQGKREFRHHVNSTMRIIFSGYINLVVMYKLCYEEINKLVKLNDELFDFHEKVKKQG